MEMLPWRQTDNQPESENKASQQIDKGLLDCWLSQWLLWDTWKYHLQKNTQLNFESSFQGYPLAYRFCTSGPRWQVIRWWAGTWQNSKVADLRNGLMYNVHVCEVVIKRGGCYPNRIFCTEWCSQAWPWLPRNQTTGATQATQKLSMRFQYQWHYFYWQWCIFFAFVVSAMMLSSWCGHTP